MPAIAVTNGITRWLISIAKNQGDSARDKVHNFSTPIPSRFAGSRTEHRSESRSSSLGCVHHVPPCGWERQRVLPSFGAAIRALSTVVGGSVGLPNPPMSGDNGDNHVSTSLFSDIPVRSTPPRSPQPDTTPFHIDPLSGCPTETKVTPICSELP